MSEQANTAVTAEPEAPVAELETAEAPVQHKKTGRGVAWLALLLVLLLTATLVAGAYWLWPQWQALQQQASQNQQAVVRLGTEQVEQQLQQLQQQVAQQQAQWLAEQQQASNRWQQAQQQSLDAEREQLQRQVLAIRQQVEQRDGAPPRYWALTEVRFLLKRASQNVVIQQDLASARWLLQAADEQLAKLDEANLIVVRQAIRNDLSQLAQITLPDHTELHLQLAQLRRSSMQLPLKQQEQQLVSEHKVDGELANWRANLASYWQQISGKLFKIRAAEPNDFYSLSAEQQLTIGLSLQQQLLLAEMALLQQEPAVFQRALQQAADLLQRYFASADPAVQQASETLVALAALNVTPVTLPALTSLPELERQLSSMTEAVYE